MVCGFNLDERRLGMRRECGTQDEYVKWLKSLGCVFFAPMTRKDGMTDLISGTVGEIPSGNSNCNVTYDNSIGMWVFDTQGGYQAGVWWTGLDLFPDMIDGVSLLRTQPMTMFCTLKIITNPTSNYYNIGMALGAGDNGYNYNVSTGSSRAVANYLCPYPTFGMRAADTKASTIGCKRDGLVFEYIKDGSAISHSDNDPWKTT